ncbi:uncharacterized protein PV07_05074 [Cladophialophora immunda]|uniref:Xylanolytic transcriptional activator regulatory domain-containing protein n=1 Tax=Cladophialophora immunda TaxID=569365 RepID=A0A0D2D0D0_9EURO|nr:uncharacterized protein PV07_05074 [Cladophialophora immunda]KIW29249.1 hypothetical protein PV07_05074 [Cladophialophora immunda]
MMASRIQDEGRHPGRHPSLSLPPFIKEVDSDLSPVDQEYLGRKGALSVPDTNTSQALLQCYLQLVHPAVPFLAISQINAIARSHDSHEAVREKDKVSLLLWQAMLFTATAFVDDAVIHQMGFSTRAVARRVFYKRARTLYDLQAHRDQIQTLQAMILLTYWVEDRHDDRNMLFWINAAKSLLQILDIPSMLQGMDPSTPRSKMLRRTWWACFVRESMLVLSLRRGTVVEHMSPPLSIIGLRDFDLDEEQSSSARLLIRRASPQPAFTRDQQHDQAIIFIELAKLCICANRVIMIRTTLTILERAGSNHRHGRVSYTDNVIQEVARCEDELRQWSESQSAGSTPSDTEVSLTPSTLHVRVFQILLQATFFSVVGALYRPFIYPAPEEVPHIASIPRQWRSECLHKFRAVAQEICAVAEIVLKENLGELLPSFVIFPFCLGAVVRFLHLRAKPDGQADDHDLGQCITVLAKLGERFDHATPLLVYFDRLATQQYSRPDRRLDSGAPEDFNGGSSRVNMSDRHITVAPMDPESTLRPTPPGIEEGLCASKGLVSNGSSMGLGQDDPMDLPNSNWEMNLPAATPYAEDDIAGFAASLGGQARTLTLLEDEYDFGFGQQDLPMGSVANIFPTIGEVYFSEEDLWLPSN